MMRQRHILTGMVTRIAVAGALAIIAVAPGFSAAAGLDAVEYDTALRVANATPWQVITPPVVHPLGVQSLSVELDSRKQSSGTRRARVYQYHYDHQSARLLLIDVDALQLVQQWPIESIHLPLSTAEIAMARSLLQNHQTLMQQLSNEHLKRLQTSLTSLDEIDLKASIYEPTDAEHPCASQRCALLSLFDRTRTVFTLEPVIYLRDLSVTTLQLRN